MFLILFLQLQFDTTTTSGKILNSLFWDLEPTQEIIEISNSIYQSVLNSIDTLKTENWEGEFLFKLRKRLSKDKRIQDFCKEVFIEKGTLAIYEPSFEEFRELSELHEKRSMEKELSKIRNQELRKMVERYLRYGNLLHYTVEKDLFTEGLIESTLMYPDYLSWFEKEKKDWVECFLIPKIKGDTLIIVNYSPGYFENGYLVVQKVSGKSILLDKDFYIYRTHLPKEDQKEFVLAYIMADIPNKYGCVIINKYGNWMINLLTFELPEKYREQWIKRTKEIWDWENRRYKPGYENYELSKLINQVLSKSNSEKLKNLRELEKIKNIREGEKCDFDIPIKFNQNQRFKVWWVRKKVMAKSGEKIKATAIFRTDTVYNFSFEMKPGVKVLNMAEKKFNRKDTLNYLRERINLLSFEISPNIDSLKFLFKMPNVLEPRRISFGDLKISFFVMPTKLSIMRVRLSIAKSRMFNFLFGSERYRWRFVKYKEGTLAYRIFFFVFTNPVYVFIIIVPVFYFLGLKLKKIQNKFYERRNKKSK